MNSCERPIASLLGLLSAHSFLNPERHFLTLIVSWVHQNRASPFASDFRRRGGYRREFRSEDHFYPFHSQKKSRFASGFLRRGNRASWGLKKSRDFLGSGQNRRRSRRESRDFSALRSCLIHACWLHTLTKIMGNNPPPLPFVRQEAPEWCFTIHTRQALGFFLATDLAVSVGLASV